jgi:transcriptional regulator with XRE-family HTH domain
MTQSAKESLGDDSPNSSLARQQQPTNLITRESLIQTLRTGPDARIRFVESHLNKGLAFQIRSMRDQAEWSQGQLAEKVSMNQNAISRLENPNYGKATITTLKRIAAAFDVGLVIRFVPFSQMVDWVSGTPHLDEGLSQESLRVPNFDQDIQALAPVHQELGSVDDELDGIRDRRHLGCLARRPEPIGAAGAAT